MSVVPKGPRPFLMSDEMLKRDFASALHHTSGKRPQRNRFLEDGVDSKMHVLDFLTPLWCILRVFGVFPVANKEGKFTYSLLSAPFGYSLSVYVLLGVYSVSVLCRLVSLMNETALSFGTLVFSYLCILYSFPQTVVPVIHWFEAPRVAGYLNDWTDLQRSVESVTGKPFVCTKNRKKVVYAAILILVECSALVLVEFQLLDAILLVEIPYYFYTITLVHMHCALWHFLCCALSETAEHLIGMLESEFRRQGTHLAPTVVKYQTTWCTLSRLTSATGDVLVHTVAFVLTLWSTVLLLTVYGAMPGGVGRDYPMSRQIGLALSVLIVFAVIYLFCDSAHQTTNTVGRMLLDRLSLLTTSDKSTQCELDHFIKAVTIKTPVINLGGYVDINRALLTSLFSSLATYLIVLIQFRMSDTTQASSRISPPVSQQSNLASSTQQF